MLATALFFISELTALALPLPLGFLCIRLQMREAAMKNTISRDELNAKIERGDDFQLVEALPEDEFRKRHLPGVMNLPPSEAE